MSAVGNPIEDYVLGNNRPRTGALETAGRSLKVDRAILLSAGIEPGMSVLDLGCAWAMFRCFGKARWTRAVMYGIDQGLWSSLRGS